MNKLDDIFAIVIYFLGTLLAALGIVFAIVTLLGGIT